MFRSAALTCGLLLFGCEDPSHASGHGCLSQRDAEPTSSQTVSCTSPDRIASRPTIAPQGGTDAANRNTSDVQATAGASVANAGATHGNAGMSGWVAGGAPAIVDNAFAGARSGGPSTDQPGTSVTGPNTDHPSACAGTATPAFELASAPLVFAPRPDGFGLSVALAKGAPECLRAEVRAPGIPGGQQSVAPTVRAPDLAEWRILGLDAGTTAEYEVVASWNGGNTKLYSGSVSTLRPPGSEFTFAVFADPHISPPGIALGGTATVTLEEQTLRAVGQDIQIAHPDFIINLGDMVDFDYFGFNAAPPEGSWARLAYLNYRQLLSDTIGRSAHFLTIGNWEGENGYFTAEEISRPREQRLLYLPGPKPDTYPQAGSPAEDYYAFVSGDALFVVLNVMSYTPTQHLLSGMPGQPDDWTLGETQLAWLRSTLEQATAKWRFLFIHHTVGGKAGNFEDSAYGRGGGQAAYVGEQAIVHQLMLEHGVQIFFYGHDHVFTDMVVDGIHYTLPGSAGAPWKFTPATTGYSKYWPDSGYARVAVDPSAVKVSFIAMGGALLNEYRVE